jgi:hypothetical protein
MANKTANDKKKAIFILKKGEELLVVYRSKRKAESDTYEEIQNMIEDQVKPNKVVFTEVMVFRRAKRQEKRFHAGPKRLRWSEQRPNEETRLRTTMWGACANQEISAQPIARNVKNAGGHLARSAGQSLAVRDFFILNALLLIAVRH